MLTAPIRAQCSTQALLTFGSPMLPTYQYYVHVHNLPAVWTSEFVDNLFTPWGAEECRV
jgi:hypothetical protein